MCQERDCFECPYPDCVSDSPPLVDLDPFLQLHLDEYQQPGTAEGVQAPTITPEKGLERLMSADLREFCRAHGVEPRVRADLAILERARLQGFTGKKLEKALYKVRHRENYLASKKRNRTRKKTATLKRHA